jgi:CheY-like chemotaxis protein
VLVTVSDTGVGIPHEIQERIFEPFFTTKEVGKGTGLGLATVYGIVRSHQGMIHVYSEPGHGAAFKIYLPAIGENLSDEAPEKDNKPLSVGKETIMIAEDEDIVRDMMIHVLESSGYRVFSARNGEEAISLFEKRFSETDLVILDVIMPKVSGQKVYEHIRAIHPDIAVIFMSGYTRDILKPEVFTDNGCQMIQKPCTPSVLLQTIRDVLDARKT